MKKLVTVAVCALVAVAAFAQITVSGNAQSFWIPYKGTFSQDSGVDDLHQTAVQVPWGGPDLSAGVSVSGWSEFAGIQLSMDVSYGTGNRASNPFSVKAGHSYVWVQPWDFLKLTLGTPYDGTLQGKVGSSDLARYVLATTAVNYGNDNRMEYGDGQYNIFTRINPYAWGNADFAPTRNLAWPEIAAAAMLNITPIDGLNIIAFFAPEMFQGDAIWGDVAGSSFQGADPVNGIQRDDVANAQDFYDVAAVYKNLQVAVGYEIPNFGLVRAQFIGLRNTVELAASTNLVPFTSLDVGLKIPFEGIGAEKPGTTEPDEVWKEYMYKQKKDYQVSVGATFQYADFSLLGRIDTAFAGSDSSSTNVHAGAKVATRGLDLLVYLVPSYNLGFATVGADFGFEYEAEDDFTKAQSYHKVTDSKGIVSDGLGAGIRTGFGIWIDKKLGPGTLKGGFVTRLPTDWHSVKLPTEIFIPILVRVGF